jgi:hypothetical protein
VKHRYEHRSVIGPSTQPSFLELGPHGLRCLWYIDSSPGVHPVELVLPLQPPYSLGVLVEQEQFFAFHQPVSLGH